jgi:dolichol-phosphate mannosyltransferase
MKIDFREINLGIVCPLANEQDTVQSFIEELLKVCRSFYFSSIKLFVVIDNASSDRTLEIITALEFEIEELRFGLDVSK